MNLSTSTFDPGPAPASQTRVYEILQAVNGSDAATGRTFTTVIVLEKR